MTLAATRELRELDDHQLSELWRAGEISLPGLERECARRDAGDRARARRGANRAEWRDAVEAQYRQASADCAGRLLSGLGMAEVATETELWTGADSWAEARASEELRNWWEAHGGRLSWARWQSDQRRQARAYRDERDLAAIDPAPYRPAGGRASSPAPGRAAKPRPAGGRAARPVTPERTGRAAPAPGPIARYTAALDQLTARLTRIDHLAARIAARPVPGGNRP